MNWLAQLSEWFARFRCWFLVRPWEMGIRVRGGKRIFEAGPGIHFAVPFLDEVFIQSTRLRVLNLPIQTVTNKKSGHTVTVSGVVRWRVDNVRLMYERLHTPEDWIYNSVMSSIAEVVSESVDELTPQSLGQRASEKMRGHRSLGVRVKGVAITDLAMVRTYRLISGEGNSGWSWDRVGALDSVHGQKAS